MVTLFSLLSFRTEIGFCMEECDVDIKKNRRYLFLLEIKFMQFKYTL